MDVGQQEPEVAQPLGTQGREHDEMVPPVSYT